MGRRLTFEYVLLAGLNDSDVHARQLAGLLKGRCQLLNVIPYNPVAGLPYQTPSPAAIAGFREILTKAGIDGCVPVEKPTLLAAKTANPKWYRATVNEGQAVDLLPDENPWGLCLLPTRSGSLLVCTSCHFTMFSPQSSKTQRFAKTSGS